MPTNESRLESLKKLWDHFSKKKKKQLILVLALMTAGTFLELISVGAVLPFLAVLVSPETITKNDTWKQFIPGEILNNPTELLIVFSIGFILTVLLSGIARFLLIFMNAKMAHAIGADISCEIYRRTLYQPYIIHTQRNASEIIAAIIEKSNTVVGHTVMPILSIISAAITLTAVFIAISYLNATLAIATLCTFGTIYGIILASTKSSIASHSKMIDKTQDKIVKILQEGLAGIRETIIDSTQEKSFKEYKNLVHPMRSALASVQIHSASPRVIVETIAIIALSLSAFNLDRTNGTGFIEVIPIIGTLTLGIQRLLPIIQQGYAALTLVRGSRASLEATLQLLDQPLPDPTPAETYITFERKIEVRNLSYKYAHESNHVLNNISFQIKKGARVGIIGKTGSGKSTLLDLVMGLLHTQGCEIMVDDTPITSNNSNTWHKRIAHVPQSIFLIDASITENIAFGENAETIEIENVKNAAKLAKVDAFVEKLPDGYSTIVGERGVRLSGGQRQRIGIARALYKNADVLVFDEATSALDIQTEREIMDSLDSLNRNITIISIAHRLSTLERCDFVIELDKGSISRIATYQEIINAT